jgi:vancomycin resistance protein YoaR
LDFSTLASEISKLNIEQDPLHSITVPLLNEAAQPKITEAQLSAEKITGLLAQYSTQFDASLVNRTENIRLAARALDGKLLAPGERFSFNESVGERTAEAGYKEAMIIEGNIFTPGLGGGVCQVSSNLYNAVTLAQLEILERHPHSLPVTYVPPGQDATVAYPQLDFKFMNNSEAYVLIRSSVVENTLTFQLYGNVKN